MHKWNGGTLANDILKKWSVFPNRGTNILLLYIQSDRLNDNAANGQHNGLMV